MKLLEEVKFEVDHFIEAVLKRVEYFGIPLTIYDDIRWLATDENGSLYGYDWKPILSDDEWLPRNSASNAFYIGNADLEGMDWEKTLLEIKNNDGKYISWNEYD